MENRNVATFIKVVEMNNFTRAAESLGYSQAAVTAQIKQLEHELGAPLFDRIGKRINLTRAGEAFLPYAFRLLKAEDEAIACIREQGDLSGTLRIGTTSSLSIGALPQAAIDFIKEHPNVNIVIQVSDFTKDLREKLIAGTILRISSAYWRRTFRLYLLRTLITRWRARRCRCARSSPSS